MSKEDIKVIRKNTIKKLKKQKMPHKIALYAERVEYLNYGANSSLQNTIKSGYAIVVQEKPRKQSN
jgi:hypothetical protein